MKGRKKGPVRPDTAAAERLKDAIVDGEIFHAYLFEGSRQNNEALVEWFTAAALCEKQDGSVCGECASCRQILDGISPFTVRVRTEAEEEATDERFNKRITSRQTGTGAGSSPAGRKKAAKSSSLKIRDKQIEEVIQRSLRSSLSAGRIFTVIDRADTITPKGQNRLLKTLEEPPEGIVLILLTGKPEAILDTIRSRCMLIRTDSAASPIEIPGKPAFRKRAVRAAADLIKGTPSYMLWKEIDYFAGTREKAADFCELAQLFYRDAVMYQNPGSRELVVLGDYEQEIAEAAASAGPKALSAAVKECEIALRDLEANVSMKHALRSFMFSIQLGQDR